LKAIKGENMKKVINKAISNHKFLFILITMSLMASAAAVYYFESMHLKEIIFEQLKEIADTKTQLFSNWIYERNNDAAILMHNPRLSNDLDLWIKNPADRQRRQLVSDRLQAINAGGIYDNLLLIDLNGNIKINLAGEDDSLTMLQRSLLKKTISSKTITWGEFYSCKICRKKEIDIFVPFFAPKDVGGNIVAVLMMNVDPKKYIDPFIETWPVHSNTSEILILRKDELARFKNRNYFETEYSDTLPMTEVLTKNKEWARGIFIYRNIEVLAVIKTIPGTNWYLVAKTDKNEAYAPLRLLLWTIILVLGFLMTLLGTIIALIVSNQKKDLYRRQYEMELEQKALIKHFDYITKYSNDMFFLINESGWIVMANDRALQVYGYNYDEILKLKVPDFRTEESMKTYETDFEKANDLGGTIFETEHKRKDGSVLPVEISLRRIDIEGKKYFQAIIRDISERRKNEEALRESEAKFYNAFHASSIAIGLADLETGKYIEVNDMFANTLERRRDEIIGKSSLEMDFWTDPRKRDDFFAAVKENPNLRDYPADIKSKSGRIMKFLISTGIIESGGKKYLLISAFDITERIRMENALRESEEKFQKAFYHSPVAMSITDLESRMFIDVNAKFLELSGKTRQEIVGHDGREIDVWADPQKGEEYFEQIKAGDLGKNYYAEMKAQNGKILKFLISGEFIDFSGRKCLLSSAFDITQRVEMEEKVKNSEAKYRDLFENNNDAIYVHELNQDEPGRFIEVNPKAQSMLGYSREELLKMTMHEITPKEHLRQLPEIGRQLKEKGRVSFETEGIAKDGTLIPSEINLHMFELEGRTVGMAVVRDISEKKKAEEALKESEMRFRAVAQSANDAVIAADNEGNIVFWNNAAHIIYGYEEKEMLGRSIEILMPERFRKAHIERLAKLKENQSAPTIGRVIESEGLRKDGSIFPAEYSVSSWQTKAGKYFTALVRDITERKKAEKALRESEEKYRHLYENATIGIYRTTPDGRILMANSALVKMLGYENYDDLARINLENSGYSKNDFRKEFKKIIEAKGVVNGWEAEWLKKNGERVYVRESARAVYDEQENIVYYDGVIEDITEGRATQMALEQSEYRYRTTLDAVKEMIHVIDRNYTILLMNRVFIDYCRDNGLCEQCIGKKVFEVFPFLSQSVRDEYERVFKTKEIVNSEDINIVGGYEIITKTRKIPIIENGQVVRIVTIISDVTEIVKNEQVIRESQEKYQSIYDNSKDGIFLMKDDTFIDCNQALLTMFAMDGKDEIVGKTPETTSPEYQDNGMTSKEYARQLLDGALSGKIMRFEWKHKKKTGKLFDCDISLNRLELKGEYYLMAILRDVTEKKDNDRKLRESEQRYSIVMEKTGQLVYDYNINTEAVKWAGAAIEVTGYSLEELNSSNIKWEEMLHPEDSEYVLRQLAASRSAVGSFDMEYRFRRADGNYIFVSDHGIYLPDQDGKATKMLGTMEDITGRKQIEIALKQSEERYKRLFTDTLEAMSITKGGRIFDVNEAWLKLHKYNKKDEVVGKDIIEIVAPKDRMIIEERRTQVFSIDSERIFEVRDLTKKGDIIDVEVSSSTITLDGDQAILSAVKNISWQKLNERKIRELNKRFEYVLGVTKTGFDIIDSSYNIIYIDPEWEKEYGPRGGEKCYKYFMERDKPCDVCGIEKALKTKKTTINEEYLVKENRWIEVHTIPFQDEDGEWMVAEFNMDITQKKHDQKILENRQKALMEVYKIATSLDETFQSICDRVATNLSQILNVPHMAVQLLKNGKINVISYFEEGKIQNDIILPLEGTPCERAYQEGKHLEISGSLRQLFPSFFLNRLYDLNSYLGMPIKDKKGKVLGLICIYDYNQHHYSDEELILLEIFAHYLGYEVERSEAEIQLREADKGKLLSDIASGVAHEVRNPLHAIQAISEAMARDIQDNPDYAEYLTHIKIQVNRLSQLMKELLELGKPIQASGFKREPVYDMITSAKRYWDEAQTESKNNVNIINKLDSGKYVCADNAKIQEVVINLLENASQHSSSEKDITIEISNQGQEYLSIKVIDQGTGIKPGSEDNAFEPFYTTRKKGTGLGLAICKRIVESHKGSIQLRNNENGPGCTVQFILPICMEGKNEADSSVS
jgi:PAS domain S-box-containing protein